MITPLSEEAKEIIFGSLLGDGSLSISERYKNARFSFRHSHKQKDYFFWKVKALREIASERSWWKQEDEEGRDRWGYTKYRFQSKAMPVLTEIHGLTHIRSKSNKVRVRRKWLNKMSALSLAIWWQDDGSLVSDTRQGVICTDGFSLEEVKILDRYMKKVWGISTSIGCVKDTNRYRLWIRSSNELMKFLRIIIPHVHAKSMLKKILLCYKDTDYQERWISEMLKIGNFDEQTIRRELEKRKSSLKQLR